MLHIHLLTLFPELFEKFTQVGLIGRAIREELLKITPVQLRNFAINSQGAVDDTPYGGGCGMILRPEPACQAIEHAKGENKNAKVILLTPRGQIFDQTLAKSLSHNYSETGSGLIFLCSRYEGVDERIVQEQVDLEICLGDFVLMGAEVAAMCVIESISRLIPGVLGNPESILNESFEHNLLEHPHYTKPQEFRAKKVPEILLSGHHGKIETWRKTKAKTDTIQRRPDLFDAIKQPTCEVSVALIHYPVVDKNNKVITSSITNIDLHDIARTARTFGITRLYIVHPVKTLRRLVAKICEHWDTGYGSTYNTNRRDALSLISLVPDFDDVLFDIDSRTGKLPKVISTSATSDRDSTSFATMRAVLHTTKEPHLIILGTGWGLTKEMHDRAHYQLEPISGLGDYNHLSVRAAAAIMIDRLLGIRHLKRDLPIQTE